MSGALESSRRFQHIGPKDHMELATSQGRAVQALQGQPGYTTVEINMPGEGRPTRSMGVFPRAQGQGTQEKEEGRRCKTV